MNPPLDRLKDRLLRLVSSANPFEATVYRSCTPRFATRSDLFSGEGSRRHGGRWNPKGVAVVYTSLTLETALAETLAQNRYYGIPPENAMPRLFVAMNVKLGKVLNLGEGSVRQHLRVSLERILGTDWREEAQAGQMPITQALGQASLEIGLEGLLVPSAAAAPIGQNLLIFPENLSPDSSLQLINANQLTE